MSQIFVTQVILHLTNRYQKVQLLNLVENYSVEILPNELENICIFYVQYHPKQRFVCLKLDDIDYTFQLESIYRHTLDVMEAELKPTGTAAGCVVM